MQPEYDIKNLTETDKKILYLIALGYSNREIASILFYSIDTIKNCIKSILKKISAKNRVEAVAICCRNSIFKDKLLIDYFKDKI